MREGSSPRPSFQQLDFTHSNSSSNLNNMHLVSGKQQCQWIKRGMYTCIKAHYCKYYLPVNSLNHLFWMILAKVNLRTLCNPGTHFIQTQKHSIFLLCLSFLSILLSLLLPYPPTSKDPTSFPPAEAETGLSSLPPNLGCRIPFLRGSVFCWEKDQKFKKRIKAGDCSPCSTLQVAFLL